MLATISFVFGILLGTIVLNGTRRREVEQAGQTQRPTTLSWWTLVLGLTTVTALILGLRLTSSTGDLSMVLLNISIACAFAAVITGIGNLRRQVRDLPTWVGLIAGLTPAIFWIAFAVGHIISPGE